LSALKADFQTKFAICNETRICVSGFLQIYDLIKIPTTATATGAATTS